MRTRMISSQVMILLLFLMTTAFVRINTDKWQDLFLMITLLSVAIVNAFSSIFGGTLFGIVGRFSSKYITAMSGGQALSGIVTTLVEITSIWIGASPVISGLVYFAIGDFLILCSFIAYLCLEKQVNIPLFIYVFLITSNKIKKKRKKQKEMMMIRSESNLIIEFYFQAFFKHHMKEELAIQQPNFSLNAEVSFIEGQKISFKKILGRIWPYGLSMFLVFFISLSVYPAVTVLVESQDKGKNNPWNG